MAESNHNLMQRLLAEAQAANRAAPPLAPGGSGTLNAGMEGRVAKVESDIGHILREIGDIKIDIRDIKKALETDFRLVFGALILAVLGLAGIMAKGFHWL
jgi:hypothetical protein